MQRSGGGQEGAGSRVGSGSSCIVRGILQLCDPHAAEPLCRLQQLQEVSHLEANVGLVHHFGDTIN